MTTERERLAPDDLLPLFLFEALTLEQRTWLVERGRVESVDAGEVLLQEGEPAELVVVLLSGEITLSRRVGADDVLLVRTDQVGAYAGATRSYVEDPDANSYTATVRAVTPARLFALRGTDFAEAIKTWFPMTIHLLEGLFFGMQNSQRLLAQRQRLIALGQLSAGLTHELNNPAAAAVRANDALKVRVAGMRRKLAMIAHDEIDTRLLETLVDVQEEAVQIAADAPTLSALQESEREDEIVDWLEEHGVQGAYELAPIFVAAGSTSDFLDKVEVVSQPELLESAVRWLAYTLETEQLLDEIGDSVNRISSLVQAAREYSHMDRSPYELVDVHVGIESTLVMLSTKLKQVEVVEDYDRSLPPVPAYAAELNQVWTNLIDNAVQAMDGAGRLTIRTYGEEGRVLVDITDTGPGIPKDNLERIFEPFFTTKPIGEGTGLGLDISYKIVVMRHGGDLSVVSSPGDTRFTVCLPLTERSATLW